MISDKTNKENYTVNIRGLEMSLSEAQGYLTDIKENRIKIELNERERKEYENIKNSVGIKNEKEYLEMIVAIPLKLKELIIQQTECEKKGHLGEFVMGMSSYGESFCRCNLCGDVYLRPMNSEELIKFEELIKTRHTI